MTAAAVWYRRIRPHFGLEVIPYYGPLREATEGNNVMERNILVDLSFAFNVRRRKL